MDYSFLCHLFNLVFSKKNISLNKLKKFFYRYKHLTSGTLKLYEKSIKQYHKYKNMPNIKNFYKIQTNRKTNKEIYTRMIFILLNWNMMRDRIGNIQNIFHISIKWWLEWNITNMVFILIHISLNDIVIRVLMMMFICLLFFQFCFCSLWSYTFMLDAITHRNTRTLVYASEWYKNDDEKNDLI